MQGWSAWKYNGGIGMLMLETAPMLLFFLLFLDTSNARTQKIIFGMQLFAMCTMVLSYYYILIGEDSGTGLVGVVFTHYILLVAIIIARTIFKAR
jgi:hypothetical protein